MFSRLIHHLQSQIRDCKAEQLVEILHDATPQGQKTIGEKRNQLMERARGEYIAFIDDDDWVMNTYIESVLKAIKHEPDVVGFTGWYYVDGAYKKPFIHSIYAGVDSNGNPYYEDDKAYYRCPNHLNPMKRIIANKFRFPLNNHGEDTDWAMQIYNAKVLNSESTIEGVLYFYKYVSSK